MATAIAIRVPLTRTSHHGAMTHHSDLTLFQKILLATDGTVTELIALYAGEPISVTKLQQDIHAENADVELQCPAPTRVLGRKILLCGASKNYLYAESRFVVDRLPESIREDMLNTNRPIGLLWKEARLETFREIVGQKIAPCPAIAQHFGVATSEPFVERSYLIHHGGKPLGVITEKWPISQFR